MLIPPLKRSPFLKQEGASQQVKRLEKEQAACPPTPSRPTPHKTTAVATPYKTAVATPHKTAVTATPRHQLSEREQIVILEAKLAQRDQEVKVRSPVLRIRDPVPFFDPGIRDRGKNQDPDPG
jgi:hypothetical protein